MRQIDALRRLPAPGAPTAMIACDTVLFQELIVARETGLAEGATHTLLNPPETPVRHFTGRLTAAGAAHLRKLEEEERTDGRDG